MEECIHGMDPSWCSTCLYGPDIRPPLELVATFTARFPGRCLVCDGAIHEGDQIARWSDDTYTHEDCTP